MWNKRSPETFKDQSVRRLQKQLHELRDHLQEQGLLAKKSALGKMKSVGSSLHDYLDEGRERMGEIEDDVSDFVRTRPLQAIMAAIGIGFLLSLIIRRR